MNGLVRENVGVRDFALNFIKLTKWKQNITFYVTYKSGKIIFRPIIANNYISVYPVKLCSLMYSLLVQFLERAKTNLQGWAGRYWPAGHRLGTSDVGPVGCVGLYVRFMARHLMKGQLTN